MGGKLDCDLFAYTLGVVSRPSSFEAVAGARDCQRDYLLRQSRHLGRYVLHSSGLSVHHEYVDGDFSRVGTPDFRLCVSRLFFCAWAEVLSSESGHAKATGT